MINPVNDDKIGWAMYRINCGGSWENRAKYAQFSFRNFYDPNYGRKNFGFRVVRNK